jgi:hypothetical protein
MNQLTAFISPTKMNFEISIQGVLNAERNQATKTAKEMIVTFGLPFLLYTTITGTLTHVCYTFKVTVSSSVCIARNIAVAID